MEKPIILKKLENRRKLFEEYLHQIKTPANKQGEIKNQTIIKNPAGS